MLRDSKFWHEAFKRFSVLRESLDNAIAKVEVHPDLDRTLYSEARRKLEEAP